MNYNAFTSEPIVVSDRTLKHLCQKHLFEIGAGIPDLLPNFKIRYVSDNNEFGYAYFGDFFFSLTMNYMFGSRTINIQKSTIKMLLRVFSTIRAKGVDMPDVSSLLVL